jgi:outer membrane protein OmpA-like peptidoglycan-associated protein
VTQAVDPSVPQGKPAGGGGTAGMAAVVAVLSGLLLTAGSALAVRSWTSTATQHLTEPEKEKPKVAIADQAEVAYCTPQFKQVLERVLHACGLAGEGEGARRGCKPADVKTFASISDDDFNALFTPLKDRGGVVMFDEGRDDLDDKAKKLLEERWYARKGARYFFVVARASKTGSPSKNNALSHRRANSVMFFLKQLSNDPEIEQKVGLLWLGNEFAQLSKEYCTWPNSRADEKCDDEAINRSAFVSWVDCRL